MVQKFLIVEDHPLFAEALQSTIRSARPDVQLTHAGCLGAAKAALEQNAFDLILLDLWLPDTHGFKGLVELRHLRPKTPIAVNSAFEDHSVIQNAIVCGAAGFIPKSAGKDYIVRSIDSILAGDIALPDSYMPPNLLSEKDLAALTRRLNSLTPKQLLVLHMVCQGLLNKQIAHQLDINETTVKAHVSEILRKLSVASRTQAVVEISKLSLTAILALYTGDKPTNVVAFDRRNDRH
jgi:DNA-binding NarL/FixJ family response regulator